MIVLSSEKLKQEEKFVYYETDLSISFSSGKSIFDYCDCSNMQNTFAISSFFGNKSAYLSQSPSSESRFSVTIAEITANTQLPPHTHPENVLNIILDGELEFTLSEKKFNCNKGKGNAIFIPANVSHSLRVLKDAKILEIWCNS